MAKVGDRVIWYVYDWNMRLIDGKGTVIAMSVRPPYYLDPEPSTVAKIACDDGVVRYLEPRDSLEGFEVVTPVEMSPEQAQQSLRDCAQVARELVDARAAEIFEKDPHARLATDTERMVLTHLLFVAHGRRLGWPKELLIARNRMMRDDHA